MDLEQAFQDFIRQNQLLRSTDRVLVAVSGGVDSVVLAHLLRQSKQNFGLAHANFQLRGEESDGDAQFVRELAEQWDLPVFVQRFPTKEYADQNGLSVQMAARALRYRWFEEVRQAENYDAIATGHNLNDSVETALFHFIRGTGLTGLSGIPVQNGPVIRPLLFAGRDEIMAYASRQNIRWREDASNLRTDYTRNAIRQHVMPEILALNPAFIKTAANTIEHLRAADQNLQYFLKKWLGDPDAEGVCQISKAEIAAMPAPLGALFDLFQPLGFTADQVQQVLVCWNQPGTEWLSASGFRLLMDRDALLLTERKQHDAEMTITADDLLVRLPDQSRLVMLDRPARHPFPEDKATILVDAAKVQFPLHLRRWRPGDVFCPLGMGGKRQKLQDFFTNQKLSTLEKEQAWILEDKAGQIMWVLGMRMDERFKIDDSSVHALQINWIK